jgi:hypothetical protein
MRRPAPPLAWSLASPPLLGLLVCLAPSIFVAAISTPVARLAIEPKGPPRPRMPKVRVCGDAFSPRLLLEVREAGLGLSFRNEGGPLGANDWPRLASALAEVKAAHPDGTEVTMQVEDGVPHRRLVQAMDAAVGAGFPRISFSSESASGI